jgi:phage tail sheath protein FI
MTMGRPVANKHKVQRATWRKWSEQARRTFNGLYDALPARRQWIVVSPDTPAIPQKQWQVLRWNVAWVAADAVDD